MDLTQDWLDFIDSLQSNGVEFLVVGAFAMGLHNLPRTTGDIDFWVRPTQDNSLRVWKTLQEFGLPGIHLEPNEFTLPGKLLILGHPPGRIDVMNSIDGVTFEAAWQARVTGELGGRRLDFISADHLLQNKSSTGRLKDKADAQRLVKALRKKNRS